jgi:hypothetical protein
MTKLTVRHTKGRFQVVNEEQEEVSLRALKRLAASGSYLDEYFHITDERGAEARARLLNYLNKQTRGPKATKEPSQGDHGADCGCKIHKG